jgi:hypothetical protein
LGHRRRPFYSTGLPASRTRPFQPFRPQTPDRPLTTLLHTTPQRVRHPVSAGSGFTIWLQARRTDPAESGSFVLRTGCSPPVTPHPASRRRSYSYLLAGACLPGGDFHPSDQVRLQAYSQGRKPLGQCEQPELALKGRPSLSIRSMGETGSWHDRPSRAQTLLASSFQGLPPLAINDCPFGAL